MSHLPNKITINDILNKIKGVTYTILPDTTTTLCQLTLENGYTVIGKSACVDPANFELETGQKFAFDDAVRAIWPLEGYLLAELRYREKIATAS